MAARVQQQLEGMVPELRKLVELQLFTDGEARQIVERRRKYEYAIISTDPVYSRNSFRECINYEIELDRLLQQRLRRAKSQSDSADVRYQVKSDHGSVPIKVIVRRRIHRIFNRCLKRFPTHIELWKEYGAFCHRIKAFGVMNRAIMNALAKNPTCEALWKIAAKYTLTLKGSLAARSVIQMALRSNPRSLSLFVLLLELEVQLGYKLFQHSDSSNAEAGVLHADISTKTWITIIQHAIKALKGDDIFKMLFFGAAICARVSRVSDFAKGLKGYGDFASLVFTEMFNRRTEYPLLGLYVWQHRLLESLLMQRCDSPNSSSGPDAVFGSIVKDCTENPTMMPPVCRFIYVVTTSEEPTTAIEAEGNGGPAWITDVEGSAHDAADVAPKSVESTQFDGSEDEVDRYCCGIHSLKDICLLRSISEEYDSLSQRCEFVKGMLYRHQLIALRGKYRNFFLQKMHSAVRELESIIADLGNKDLVVTLLASQDDLLRLVAGQIAAQRGHTISFSGYSLSIEMSRHIASGSFVPFVEVLKSSILKTLGSTELKEEIKSSILILFLGWDSVDANCKLEAVRKSSVNLTRHQLLAGVDAAMRSVVDDIQLVDLVISLMSSSERLLIDDIASDGTVVNSLFSVVEKRIPTVSDYLRNHRVNHLGLRNFDLLSIAISIWQVGCIMSKLKTKFTSIGYSESVNDTCDMVSPEYTQSVREMIDLCEAMVSASNSVKISDTRIRLAFRSRCWHRYLQCAKELEQLHTTMPILNWHELNCSSDSVAARAYSQLGTGFVSTFV
ncbi:U3 small nucleolar RNA-associated protein 6 [Babesia sp. Xinjiang]|uniref:U3 small nucleolar RNA-associated protein 6 n=1 Tax=Babesia sp. Xinjiang TaxID=462227 RepID=UPI000A22E450|nr:U3 small nucleolar RNA-associated protein 6 [Babesia sp. Xinjiang]ORM42369.1 U3 small nucleolar RNA-associated protein 6 [Babesia sp. Xinjiang]